MYSLGDSLLVKHTDYSVEEAKKLIAKYPDRIPVIVLNSDKVILKKNKFLFPELMLWSQVNGVVKKYVHTSSLESIILMSKGNIPSGSQSLRDVYSKLKNQNGFLVLEIIKENTFG